MNQESVRKIVLDWQGLIMRRKGIARTIMPQIINALGSKSIKIITGFRRSGKSFLLQQVIKRAVENEIISLDNILYLNFEDFRLEEVDSIQSLNFIYEVFLKSIAKDGKKLVVMDEIQVVENWEKFVRTIYERDDVEILITGSNSEMLSSELGSRLAGRFIEFFLHPFSFQEYLSYHDSLPKTRKELERSGREFGKHLDQYLRNGGLPETFEIRSDDARNSYLKGIITKVILDEVVKRYKMENIEAFERIVHYMFSEVGKILSFSSINSKLKEMGLELKDETVIRYVSYLKNAFALFECVKFDWGQKPCIPYHTEVLRSRFGAGQSLSASTRAIFIPS